MAKYEMSHNQGQSWRDIPKGDLKKRIRHMFKPPITKILDQIDEGRILDLRGWGIVKRKDGKWNSQATLSQKEAEVMARHILMSVSMEPEAKLVHCIPMAMRKKDRVLLTQAMKVLSHKELSTLKELKTYKVAVQKLQELQRFSP